MRKLPLLAAVAALVFLGAGCFGSNPSLPPVTLQYWRAVDAPFTLSDEIAAYKKIHPNVDVRVTTFAPETYERKLLEAFAENRGPDIFSIPNVWLPGWQNKIQPMPKETVIATQAVNDQKQIVIVNQKTPTMTLLELRNDYVQAAANDVVLRYTEKEGDVPVDTIFALPLSLDTVALFYNKDLLTKANVEKPPATWRDFQDQVAKLTTLDSDNKTVKQAGAAIGTGKNVRYAFDALSAIMAQNGAQMADGSGFATFNEYTQETRSKTYPPGVEALIFWQSFAVPGAPSYTWNDDIPDSLDAFVAGTSAFYFGFPSDLATIRARAPKLNFAVAPLPQIDSVKPVNAARYPVEVVAKKTVHPNEAWDFLQFIASADHVQSFLAAAKRPTALRGLIQAQLTDPDLAPFAGQSLTAQSWYRGKDFTTAEKAFIAMIETRPTTEHPEYQTIVSNAAAAINATLYSPFQ